LTGKFGIALPDGFTFARPHMRGGENETEATAEVVVRSWGLATVMMTFLSAGLPAGPSVGPLSASGRAAHVWFVPFGGWFNYGLK
jgi:hypothetical protein